MPQTTNNIDWRLLLRRIRSQKFTPIISDRVFFGADDMMTSWAEDLQYPYHRDHHLNMAALAQFRSVTGRDELAAKEDFLEFIKEYLLKMTRAASPAVNEDFLDTLEDELFELTFSEVAQRLNFSAFATDADNPMTVLAALPLPIYITTSYYDFVETALKAAGKEPRTEICRWQEDLFADVPSVYQDDPDFQPTIQEPLVYHLHGLDAYPSTLVFTEDDFLDYLIQVSQDNDIVPSRINQALVDSSLMLLGYQLNDWDFKVLFRGLVRRKRSSRRRLSISIQLSPDDDTYGMVEDSNSVGEFLSQYFSKDKFDVYWGTPQRFTHALWQNWTA